ncbi:MAG: histidinol-phosphate transaminase [Leptolyngbya sp.]|nr:histidinol-phosphate transaminase [Candidatus Melainabacteria bacterium]
MATYIQQLASKTDPLRLVVTSGGKLAPRKLVPPHIENLTAYKPGRPPEQLKKELGIEKFINLASNENPLGPPPNVIQAMQEALPEICRYPDSGSYKLREALGDKLGLNIDNIAVGSGSESIMANIVRAFLHGDDEVLTSEGTFIGLLVLVKAQGVKLRTVPLKNYSFDLEAIADAVNDRTKIIYLCNPNNPTGTIFTKQEFDVFIKKIPEHVLVLLDEAYYEFACDEPDYPDSLSYRLDNILTLRTFAKAYAMAGLRLGYGLGHEYLIDFVNRIKLPFEPNNLAQAAGLAALKNDDFLEETLANNRHGMAFLQDAFDKLGLQRVPSFGNFILCEMGSQEKVNRIHEELLKRGIAIRPLAAFGLPTCFRVTTGRPSENHLLVKHLKTIL